MKASVTGKPTSEWLTTDEACKYLNIGKTSLYKYARELRVKRSKRGRLIRWRRRELDRMLESAERVIR